MTGAVGATTGLLLWMAPPRGTLRIQVDRDAFRTVVVVGFGMNLLFIAVWPGNWRWM